MTHSTDTDFTQPRLRKYLVVWALCLFLGIIVHVPAYAGECLLAYMMTT